MPVSASTDPTPTLTQEQIEKYINTLSRDIRYDYPSVQSIYPAVQIPEVIG